MAESHQDNDEKESNKKINSLSSWLILIRPPFLLATAGSIAVGSAVAFYDTGSIDWFLFFLTLCAGVLIHMGTNSANDYFDHLSGNDDINIQYVRPFTGGSRMIQQGRLEPKAILKVSLSLLGLAAVIGIYLFLEIGWPVLVLGLFGAFSGLFYAAPPVRLASKGIGEILVGLNFGVLLVMGSYYVQTLAFALHPLLVSMPIALSITAVLWINEFPDYEADRQVGKNTLVVRIGLQNASHVFAGLVLVLYIIIGIFTVTNLINAYSIMAGCTAPLGIYSIVETRRRYTSPRTLAPANASAVANHLIILGLMVIAYLFPSTGTSIFILILGATTTLVLSSAVAAGLDMRYGSK